MKKIISTIISSAFLFACGKPDSKELENLKNEVSRLRNQNTVLKDSLQDFKKYDLESRVLVGIPDGKLQIGKPNRVTFLVHKFWELPEYEIFLIQGDKEISLGKSNSSDFKYTFVPKSSADNHIITKIKIPYNGKIIEVIGDMKVPIN